MKNAAWVRNPIDAFILAKLESQGIAPSPEAPKLTLLRRVTLDLTGLPPTPEEVGAFLTDTRPDAYERVVDRLLQSRHYGERWARPWLDLAHYADSDGYEKDQVRPFAWRYRNWVINALNNDMPFTEFTIDQLAGDLLPHPTTAQLVATGFLRNTLTNREAGVDRAEARYEQLVNRVNTMSTTWLGLTVGCAQCHDHKYDPITNKEFYQFYAFFDAADETTIEAPLAGERERYEAALPHYLGQRGNILDYYNVPELQKEWENKLRFAIANPGKNLEWDFSITSMRAMVDGAEKLLKTDPSKRSPRDQRRLTDYFLSTPGPDIGHQPEIRDRLREAYGKIMALEAELPRSRSPWPSSLNPIITAPSRASRAITKPWACPSSPEDCTFFRLCRATGNPRAWNSPNPSSPPTTRSRRASPSTAPGRSCSDAASCAPPRTSAPPARSPPTRNCSIGSPRASSKTAGA